ncbi:MAG: phage tail tape measure protein [Lachnospiraceae bacterium]|nr:phage tail tape measure protein [Lachnospiraceae bacterium]
MDEFLILLQAKLEEIKSKENINADIEDLQHKIDKLKLQAELDPKAVQALADSIGKLTNQKIVVSNIEVDANAGTKAGKNYGKQFSHGVSQEMSNASKSTEKILRDFSELNVAKRQFVDGHDIISKDDISDAERFYDTIRKAFSEFGQVTVSKGEMTDGVLDSLRVKIEQVNDEAKITRDFMLYLNSADKFGSTFKLADDDTIRSTEKIIQHLNEEKNIVNATNEEANAIKEKLAEQEKYYTKLEQASKEQLAIEKQRITAGEKQLEILDAQSKRRDSRISYNEGQIDKKGLTDTSRQRSINNLAYSGKEKFDASFAKEIDNTLSSLSRLKEKWQEQGVYVDEFKTKVETLEASLNEISIGDIKGLNAFKEQISSLSSEAKELSKIHEIQLSMTDKSAPKDNYELQVKKLIDQLKSLGLTDEEVAQKTEVLTVAHAKLKEVIESTNFDSVDSKNQAILEADEKRAVAINQVKNAYEEAKLSYDRFMQPVSNEKATSLINRINSFLTKNTKITNEARATLQGYVDELGRGVNLSRWNEINGELKKTENHMRVLGRLGASLKNQMSQAISSFSMWLSASTLVMKFISQTREAVSELKSVDTYLTEISKTNHSLTQSDLEQIGNRSFDIASKYGKAATDYLSGVQDMSRAGYKNAEAMAEVSTAAQGAGDMTAEVANKMVIATDKAYKLGGSVEELTKILDGVNWVCDNNAVNMSELSEGMSIVASTAASLGVDINELTAVLGTMAATTQQSGSEVARAFKAILLNIRQISDEEEGIDAEGLTKYEKACNALGVSLKETKDGILQTRDAMEVLKELSEEYNKLDSNDIRRTDLLNSVGGKLRSTQLDALLRQWDTYENMLKQFSEGSGTMALEAEKTAQSWEGSLKRLHNTWVDTVGNIVNSNFVISITNGFNDFLSVINAVTNKLGALGTIGFGGLGVGITTFVKNFA